MGRTPGAQPVKRISLLCATLLAVLGLAGMAGAASTERYRGFVARGGGLHFKAVIADGEITAVKGLGWRRVSIRCDQGRFRFRGGFGGQGFPVTGATFHARGSSGGGHVSHAHLSGSFRKHGRRAAGTLRIRGDLDAHHTRCDSGPKRWRAHRR
jgi:hypothetical protein